MPRAMLKSDSGIVGGDAVTSSISKRCDPSFAQR